MTAPGDLLTRSAAPPPGPQAERRDMTMQIRAEPIDKSALNADNRTIQVVWSTGVGVKRYDYDNGCYYQEELSLDPKHVRLDRLNTSGKVLDNHNAWGGVRSILGKVEAGTAATDGKLGTAKITLGRTADIDPVWERLDQGLITHVSVGYRVHKYEVTRNDGQLPIYRAIDWEPLEISLVAMPADPDAAVLRSDKAERYPCEIITSGVAAQREDNPDMMTRNAGGGAPQTQLPPAQVVEVNADQTRQQPPAQVVEVNADQTRQQPPAQADTSIGRTEALQQMTQIRDLVGAAGFQGADAERMAADFFQRGVALDGVRSALFEHVTGRSVVQGIAGAQPLHIHQGRSGDDPVVKRAAMAEAIALRYLNDDQIKAAKFTPSDQARSYVGFSVLDMAGEMLEARGERLMRGDRNGLVQRALETADFPILLAAASDKILLGQYELEEATYHLIGFNRDLNDFKTKNLVRVGDFPDLEDMQENGEFKEGAITESKESAKLKTFGRKVMLTRQALINDDLGALADFALGAAGAAKRKENKVVWGVFLSGKLANGKKIFHADHKNLAAQGAVIGVDPVGAGRAAMRQQTNQDGNRINVPPRLIVVPSTLETDVEQFLSTTIVPTSQNAVIPASMKSLTPVVEALLDDDSATAWYLLANPSSMPVVNYGWLSGSAGPQTYQETKPARGVEFQVWDDFYAAAVDFRGGYKNPGSAG